MSCSIISSRRFLFVSASRTANCISSPVSSRVLSLFRHVRQVVCNLITSAHSQARVLRFTVPPHVLYGCNALTNSAQATHLIRELRTPGTAAQPPPLLPHNLEAFPSVSVVFHSIFNCSCNGIQPVLAEENMENLLTAHSSYTRRCLSFG